MDYEAVHRFARKSPTTRSRVVTWWLGALVLTAFLSLPSHGSEKAPDSDGHLDVPSSPCGPNCLYAVFGLLGVEAEYVTLFQQTVDQPDGSSMQVLVNTARKYGLQATPLTNLSIMDLKSCPYPAILHVKKTTSSVKYDHYEVYIPSDSKALVLYDPPNASREVDRRELDDRWSGSAILLSHIPISMRFLWLPHLLRFAVSVLVVGAIALVLFFGQRNIESSRASTLKKLCNENLLLLIFAVALATAGNSATSKGLITQREAVFEMVNSVPEDFFQSVTLEELELALERGAILVDARFERDFNIAHIDSAINIPVDASYSEIKELLSAVPMDATIIVYCQSIGCSYDSIIAQKVVLNGFKNTSVFSEGWVGWDRAKKP